MGALPYGPPFSGGIQAGGCAARAEVGVRQAEFPYICISPCIFLYAHLSQPVMERLLALGPAPASCVRFHQFSVAFPQAEKVFLLWAPRGRLGRVPSLHCNTSDEQRRCICALLPCTPLVRRCRDHWCEAAVWHTGTPQDSSSQDT